ncbi:hypothetical protein, partial [Ralstonia solanacearum]|uniref:hypothetical protein n=1 Tax=Ralstonia solanacearum TaxID=305 RepID=UPI001E3FFF4F
MSPPKWVDIGRQWVVLSDSVFSDQVACFVIDAPRGAHRHVATTLDDAPLQRKLPRTVVADEFAKRFPSPASIKQHSAHGEPPSATA